MSAPWTPERTVAPEMAAALIAAQFPALAPVRVGRAWAGWDNTVYEVNDAFVFRFPRREIAVPLLVTETRVLSRLAPALPLPIPVPTFVGEPNEAYPWPFAGYPKIPGETACRDGLDDAQRARFAAPLATFLRALHDVDVDLAGLDLPGDDWGRLDLPRRVPAFRERVALLSPGAATAAAWEAELADAPAPRGRRVVHGDVYARNLLVAGGALCGVIDWGDVHAGDPAVDLAVAHGFLPPSAHAEFRNAYGPIDEATWRLARARALWHTSGVLAYALDTAEADLEREARAAFSHLAASHRP